MAKALDYAMKAHDAQITYAGKGIDYLVLAAEQMSSLLDMAPKTPDVMAQLAKPAVDLFGTPAEVMQFTQKAAEDWTKVVMDMQTRIGEVIEGSRVERLADRAKVAQLHVVDDMKEVVSKVRNEAMDAAAKMSADAKEAVYKVRDDAKDAMEKVSLETKDVTAKMRQEGDRLRHEAMDSFDKVAHDAKDAATKVRYDAAKMRHEAMDAVDKVAHDAKEIPSRIRRVANKAEDKVEAAV